jgi:diguanylate cyclase (GGDEF)-like protein/PAS domain S-box-containing protein
MLVVVSVILFSELLGIIPNPEKTEIEGRKLLAETLAVQYSLAASRDDYNVIRTSMRMLVEQNDDVISAGLRTAHGELLATAGNHRKYWQPLVDGISTADQMQVPIFKNTRMKSKWATVELMFSPTKRAGIFGLTLDSFEMMVTFVTISIFLVFFFLIRKIFRNMDPGNAVPTRVRKALDTLTDGVLLVNTRGKIMFCNQVFADYLSRPMDALVGRKITGLDWVLDEDQEPPWNKTLKTGKSGDKERLSLEMDNGEIRSFMVNSSAVIDDRGTNQGAMITFDDVTELEITNEQLKETLQKLQESAEQINRQNDKLQILATHDPLTGCLNRRSLFDNFEGQFEDALRSGKPLSCVMMDIDHFKSINDNYGHGAGDKVLQVIAKTVQGILRDSDRVFRYGGEEFCILLPGSSIEVATTVAERVRKFVSEQFVADVRSGKNISVTTSLGISITGNGAINLSQLIDEADRALYQSKEDGRDKTTVWNALLGDGEAILEATAEPGDEGAGTDAGSISREDWQDLMTGLPNLSSFNDGLKQAIETIPDDTSSMAVVLLDIDFFQRLNLSLGYPTGDEVLKILAKRLHHTMRTTDSVKLLKPGDMDSDIFRIGGDEFGVLLTGIEDTAFVPMVVARIMRILSEPVQTEKQEVFLTCSAGVSLYPKDGQHADELITCAGLALKQAKKTGVGKYSLYDDEYASSVRRDYQIENELRYAIENEELELYFQPKLDINTLKIESMEALIRWNHPDTGTRNPGEFISAAESSGLINPMGKWVMDAACRQVREWLDSGHKLPVSINLSPVQFRQPDLVEQINDAIAKAKIDPALIELEITENAIMENVEAAMDTMNTLSGFGYPISIDDFGIGYSSLEHLRRYPFDILKIDRCFIKEIDGGDSELAIARAIVEMAHSMGLRVVAEGVETESQLFALREINCDMIQGFLLGKPLPAKDAIKLVEENSKQLATAS